MKILIIEDELPIQQTLRDMLEINGHLVLSADNGTDGLKLASQRPDLILCDIGLPGLDGYQVISNIRVQPDTSDIPFIFLTARADRADQRQGMSLGADDYITKPFSEKELLDAIAARINRQRPLRERIERLMDERRREASADWSHELLTPLNGVLGGLQLIEEEGAMINPSELKELLGMIRDGAERQQRLSRKLIRFFGLEQMKEDPRRQQSFHCRADAFIQAAAHQASKESSRESELLLQCEPAELALLGGILSDAVLELVDNAFRFSQKGQTVKVTGKRTGGLYRIEILDQGPGMTPAQLETIGSFRQFNRNKREQQGLGLGIAIARLATEVGGGTFALQPGPQGRGLLATLVFPIPKCEAKPPAACDGHNRSTALREP